MNDVDAAILSGYHQYSDMKTLYFIRHAQSEANKQRILGSRKPYPLTAEGKRDSMRIAEELKAVCNIDFILSSPLERAVQTAESFAETYDLDIKLDERITEQELGIFSGMGYDEVKSHPNYENDTQNRWNWLPEGGESYSMIADRITEFLTDIAGNKITGGAENILIVTHAVSLRIITAALRNTLPDYPAEFPNNGQILKVNYSGLGREYEIESIFLGNSRDFNHNP